MSNTCGTCNCNINTFASFRDRSGWNLPSRNTEDRLFGDGAYMIFAYNFAVASSPVLEKIISPLTL